MNTMKTYFLILIIFYSTYLKSQKEDRIWYFGGTLSNTTTPGAGLDFNSGSPIPLSNSAMGLTEGSATQCDKNGNLLFYSNGMTIWDKTHNIMFNGNGLGGHYSAEQSVLFIPFPCDTNKYYLFGQDGQPTCPGTGLYYSIIDMSLNGGLGGVTSTKAVHLLSGTNEWLTGTRHANGTDFWVVTAKFDSTIFYSYKVSSLGISSPVISNVGLDSTFAYFKLMFNNKGDQLTFKASFNVGYPSIFHRRYLANFNKNLGFINTLIPLDSEGLNDGACFSPNDSLLYAASQSTVLNSPLLYQYKVKQPNIFANKTIIKQFSNYPHADMKLGPDNKIYVSSPSYDSLDVINNPNTIGIGCNYQTNALYLNGKKVRFILPSLTFSPINCVILNTNQYELFNGIKLYPNPTNGELNLISNKGITKYIIYNLQNEIVLESESELIFNITINLELSKGIYIIKFIDNNNYAFVKRFVVN